MTEINEKLNLLCPHCNKAITFSTRIIRQNPKLKCPKCKKEMNIRSDLDKKLKAAEKQIEKILNATTIKIKI